MRIPLYDHRHYVSHIYHLYRVCRLYIIYTKYLSSILLYMQSIYILLYYIILYYIYFVFIYRRFSQRRFKAAESALRLFVSNRGLRLHAAAAPAETAAAAAAAATAGETADATAAAGETLVPTDIRHVSSELMRLLLLTQGPWLQQLLELLHKARFSRPLCLLYHARAICCGETPALQQQLQRLLQQQLQQPILEMSLQEAHSELLLALLQQHKYNEARQWARLAGKP